MPKPKPYGWHYRAGVNGGALGSLSGAPALFPFLALPKVSCSSVCPTGDSPLSPVPRRVGLLHVSRVISEVFGDRLAAAGRGAPETFPLQQKVLLCSLLLLARRLRAREVTLGKVGDAGTPSGLDLGRVALSTA